MKRNSESFVRPVRDGQRGQSIALVAVALVALVAMAALVVDLGEVYFSYQELLAATNAAALAGGEAIPSTSAPYATAVAYDYSALSGDLNHHANLQNVSAAVSLACVSPATYPNVGLPPCALYPSCPTGCNVIQVTQTANVPLFFAKIFGVNSVPLSVTAVGSAKGGGVPPYHIMMVLDTTASMGMGTDTGCTQNGTSVTPEECAQYGVQTLLTQLDPCSLSLSSCQPGAVNGTYTNPDDQVGLMVFPGLCSDTATKVTTANCPAVAANGLTNTIANTTYAPDDYACPAVAPPIASYNNNPEYLILGFQGNYRTSDNSPLNTNSNIFKTIGAGTNNCGVPTPGGEGTFYAGVIQAAQDYLKANSTPGVQNIMILLSDGDATATSTNMKGSVTQVYGPQAGGVYPATAECAQAVSAATYAKNAGTLIYSISYGSETSGCTAGDTLTPCGTMQGIASLPLSQYFFSVPDKATAGGTVCANAVAITSLNQVFSTIAGDLTVSRLVPSGDF
jgi:hypothetical protein